MITELNRLCSNKQELGANTPADYSASADYAVGDYCVKSGTVYRCTTAISGGEAWTSGHWTEDADGYDSSTGAVASSTVASTNVLDNGMETRVYDGKLHFIVKLDNTPAGGQTIQAKVQTRASLDSGDWEDVADTGTIALATATAKKNGILLDVTLHDNPAIKRYVRVAYVLGGVFSTQAIVSAGDFTEAAPTKIKSFASAPPVNV